MGKNIDSFLEEVFNTTEVVNKEFRILTDEISQDNIVFHNIRGSVRLVSGMVKTPSEVSEKFNNVLNMALP